MSTLIGYIKQELNDAKLRKALLEVVEDVDALIPQNESEFAESQKFGQLEILYIMARMDSAA